MGIIRESLKSNLGFERKRNPLVSMRIGSIRPIEDLKTKYDEIAELVQHTRYLNFQSGFGKESNDLRPDRFLGKSGWGNVSSYFRVMTRDELFDYDRLVTKYRKLMDLDELDFVGEGVNFERGMDPKQAMGIGKMNKIVEWMDQLEIPFSKYWINSDFFIFTNEDIILVERMELTPDGRFPDYIRFHTTGSFDVDGCGLVSLEGCPNLVQGYFSCQINEITDLKGFPKKIEKDCYVFGNKIHISKEDILEICEVGGEIETDDDEQ